jgi:hypothetical protein
MGLGWNGSLGVLCTHCYNLVLFFYFSTTTSGIEYTASCIYIEKWPYSNLHGCFPNTN